MEGAAPTQAVHTHGPIKVCKLMVRQDGGPRAAGYSVRGPCLQATCSVSATQTCRHGPVMSTVRHDSQDSSLTADSSGSRPVIKLRPNLITVRRWLELLVGNLQQPGWVLGCAGADCHGS